MDPYLRTWKVKQVLLLLLQVASLSSCNQTLLPNYPCNSSPTSLGTTHGTEGTVRPTWIDPTLSQVGLLQTPNFPRPFALPLECLWIFDLTGLSRQAKTNYLHFYFTQVIHNFKRRGDLLLDKKKYWQAGPNFQIELLSSLKVQDFLASKSPFILAPKRRFPKFWLKKVLFPYSSFTWKITS